jgi:hypothetical protein
LCAAAALPLLGRDGGLCRALTSNFMKPGRIPSVLTVVPVRARKPPMLTMFVLRAGLWTLSLTLGGFAVFFAILSFSKPALAGHALVLFGAALAINYSLCR